MHACSFAGAQLGLSTLTQFRTTCLGNCATHSWLNLPLSFNEQCPTDIQNPTHYTQPLIDALLPRGSGLCEVNTKSTIMLLGHQWIEKGPTLIRESYLFPSVYSFQMTIDQITIIDVLQIRFNQIFGNHMMKSNRHIKSAFETSRMLKTASAYYKLIFKLP